MTEVISVRTLFFGIYGELSQYKSPGYLELPSESTVEDFLDEMRGAAGCYWLPERVVVAVNQRYAEMDTLLNDGDEVALIPPVAGG